MNLAVRNVTGKDPDAYLADYRNHSNMRMQEVKEAIGIEGRTTIFNPAYIKEKMKGGASSASTFAEIVTNTYGWNVMKPKAIDKEMWDEIYNVYVKDKYNLGTKEFFDKQNPAALMEMTAVMMESARKGMWKATPQQLKDIAKLHTETVNKYKPSCSGFVCDNAKLRNYIASKTDAASAKEYQQNVEQIRDAEAAKNSSDKGMVMKKETLSEDAQKKEYGRIVKGITYPPILNSIILIVETLVLVMMILVCFSFVLKQTFHGVKEIMIISVLVAFFVGMTWPFAIEQSKTQIAAWIADQKLMLDMAVLLSIDVALTMLFCVHHVDLKTSEHVSRRKWVFFIFLKYFPGLLIFPVLFSVLVMTIFLLPGVSFQVVAWVLAVVLLVLTPVFIYGLRWLLPERPIRLELLFLVEVLLGLMGIIGTVNGRTAVAGFNSFDALSLLGVIAIVIVGMAIGWAVYNYQIKKYRV